MKYHRSTSSRMTDKSHRRERTCGGLVLYDPLEDPRAHSLAIDFINTEGYFSPLEKHASGRIGAKPAEFLICYLSFIIAI